MDSSLLRTVLRQALGPNPILFNVYCTSSFFLGDKTVSSLSPLPTAFSAEGHFLMRMPFRARFFNDYGDPWPLIRICRKDRYLNINLENQRNTCNFTRWLIDCILMLRNYHSSTKYSTDPCDGAVWGVGLRPPLVVIACSNPAGARMSVSCECCVLSVEVSAMDWSPNVVFLRVIVKPR